MNRFGRTYNLKMEAIRYSETSETTYYSTRPYNSEDHSRPLHPRENVRSRKKISINVQSTLQILKRYQKSNIIIIQLHDVRISVLDED